MRHFSDNEKEIIKRLSEIERIGQIAIINYIYDDTDYMALEWDIDYKELWIYFKERHVSEDEAFKVYSKLLDAIFLFKYLESLSLINVYKFSSSLYKEQGDRRVIINEAKYGKNTELNAYFFKEKDDSQGFTFGTTHEIKTNIGELLEHYSGKLVHVSDALREYVNNEFKTTDEIKHTENKKISWWAIGVSAFIGVVSLTISLIGIFSSSSDKIIAPLNSINKNISDISLKVDSIKSNAIKLNEDSLNTIP